MENEEERDLRLSADRERHALSLISETITQRNERLALQRTRTSAARSQMRWVTVHKSVNVLAIYGRRNLPSSGTHNSSQTACATLFIGYDTNIGRMTELYRFCNTLKWNGEANGMCCSAGKIRLDPILEPPEPLKSLLTGEHSFHPSL
ncbi:hypothetical protein MSG28_000687 [Choristoneura fumiferana]|uniref:Uncharacterized protein n=1 Tax=Choristoneura fumiferana TaxID=7141 RepID=A0ACC0K208_CHOFU|nr:hypothetical protein MSG28_000687 [Choristoneura fumiferana]